MCNQNVRKFGNTANATISAANPNLNGMGEIVPVFIANGVSGASVNSVKITATGNTTLGTVRLFVGTHGAASLFLWREIPVGAVNQSGVVQAYSASFSDPIFLQSGYGIYASTQNAETFTVTITGKDYSNISC